MIGTNRPDGLAIAELSAADAPSGTTEGRQGLDRLIAARGLKVVTFQDWKKIDAAEIARARTGSPSEIFTSIDEMPSEIALCCGGYIYPRAVYTTATHNPPHRRPPIHPRACDEWQQCVR